jgi:hypothetical protein
MGATATKDRQISQAHSIVGVSRGRPDDDFYQTPPYATRELLKRESLGGVTWEPACGDGAIAELLPGKVVATDLNDHGYGETGVDFLMAWRRVDNIVTNPPYILAQEFVERALLLARRKVAMLLKLAFLESQGRYEFFNRTPLRTVYVFSKRLTMTRGNEPVGSGGMIAFAWFVWEHGHTGNPELDWIL